MENCKIHVLELQNICRRDEVTDIPWKNGGGNLWQCDEMYATPRLLFCFYIGDLYCAPPTKTAFTDFPSNN